MQQITLVTGCYGRFCPGIEFQDGAKFQNLCQNFCLLFKCKIFIQIIRDWEGKTGIWAYSPWLSKVMGHF